MSLPPAHVLLAVAALAIVGVVAVQDHVVPALKGASISSGLTGPTHWWLDASFALLALALALAFRFGTDAQRVLSATAALGLILTGASGTWTALLGPSGERIHAICTGVTFALAIALQCVSNASPGMWGITVWGAAAALVTHLLVPNASVTEKIGVLGLCGWLVAWAL